jgi:hypothetical protein
MFDGFSLKNCLPSNAIVIKKPLNSNEHHYSIGRPEWQSNYTTETRMKFTEKDLRNNKANLEDKLYLYPNHSNFEIAMNINNKNIYKTTNKMDYIPKDMTKQEQEDFQKNYIEHNPNMLLDPNQRSSMYQMSMKNPKDQYQKFDYDSIQFKQEKEVVDTITQQVKPKDTNMWAFDYFNAEKNKDHKYNPFQIRSINSRLDIRRHHKGYKDNKQIWDPIANRYFQCPIENDIKIEKLRKEM